MTDLPVSWEGMGDFKKWGGGILVIGDAFEIGGLIALYGIWHVG